MTTIPVAVPGDKSITHRALILAALASGESRIRGPLIANDTRATAAVLRALGAHIPPLASSLTVAGLGLAGFQPPVCTLDCQNSGTSARLFLGLLAGSPVWAVLTGDVSLRSRPMRRITTPLALARARFHELGAPDRLPIAIEGTALDAIAHDSPHASAQIKSALLLAGLVAHVPVRVTEPERSRDHTERMVAAMGATVSSFEQNGRHVVEMTAPDKLDPFELNVPGDFSSAAFFLAAGLMLPGLEIRIANVGLNATRTGLLPVLSRMGARIARKNETTVAGEETGDLVVSATTLAGVRVEPNEVAAMIDEFPVLAVLAARADGETRVTGAGELRVKESDRITTLVNNLRAVGVEAEELEDGFVVNGTRAPLAGAVATHGDHRIAMAFGVLGAQPGNRIDVDDPAAASVSFPAFWGLLRRITEAVP
jgi:3-phosphoshikimate 1-carboxyvinyltransferase